jgi:peptide/nickel transport system substrate-binding protein
VGTPSTGGTITVGQLTGSTPTFIFPILPGADASVYTAQEFMYNMFLPLYDGPVGNTPTINYALSAANPPVFSDGDKTVTIPMKPGFKWSNGAARRRQRRRLLTFDLLQAGRQGEPRQLESVLPRADSRRTSKSISAKGKYDVVMQLKKGVQPRLLPQQQPPDTNNVYPLPSTAWNVDAPGGPHHQLAEHSGGRQEDLRLPEQGGRLGRGRSRTNPLWKVVDGPFKLTSLQRDQQLLHARPEPALRRLAEADHVRGSGGDLHRHHLRARRPPLRQPRRRVGIDPRSWPRRRRCVAGDRHLRRYPNLGLVRRDHQLQGRDQPLQRHLAAVRPPGVRRSRDQPAIHEGIFKSAAVLAYGPVPSVPPTPFTPPDAVNTPFPYNPANAVALLKSHGWNVVPNGQTTCAKAGTGAKRVRRRDPGARRSRSPGTTSRRPRRHRRAWSPRPSPPRPSRLPGSTSPCRPKTFNYLIANYNDAEPGRGEVHQRLGGQQLRRLHRLLPDAVLNSGTPAATSTSATTTDPQATR